MSKLEPPQAPRPRTYWVSHPNLLAGAYPGWPDPAHCHYNVESIARAGIRCFVSLNEEIEIGHSGQPLEPYDDALDAVADELGVPLRMVRFPIRDASVPNRKTMTQILDAIDSAIAAGEPVYVHCWGGRGRTGTVVGCWLIRHGLADSINFTNGIDFLRANVPDRSYPSPENDEQEAFVRAWEMGR
jgi:protein tyrosine phosphatase